MDINIEKYTIKDLPNVVNHETKSFDDRESNIYTCSDETSIIGTEYKNGAINININKDVSEPDNSIIEIR